MLTVVLVALWVVALGLALLGLAIAVVAFLDGRQSPTAGHIPDQLDD